MDISVAASSFLGFLVGGGTLTGLFTWGAKTLVRQWLAENLVAFKEETRVWADATLADYTTKLTHLHSNRAATIETLHELVADLDLAARAFTERGRLGSTGEDAEETERAMADSAMKTFNDAEAFYRRKSLYLDDVTDKLVSELLEHYWTGVVRRSLASHAGSQARDHAEKGIDAGMAQQTIRLSNDAYSEVHEKAAKILKSLTAQFREYLDVPRASELKGRYHAST